MVWIFTPAGTIKISFAPLRKGFNCFLNLPYRGEQINYFLLSHTANNAKLVFLHQGFCCAVKVCYCAVKLQQGLVRP